MSDDQPSPNPDDQPSPERRLSAERALIAYDTMQGHFYADDGSSLYRERPRAQAGRAYAHLWPFTQALWATLDLGRVSASLLPGFDAEDATRDRFAGLERYWDARAHPPAYLSGVRSRWRPRADKYYDDNAWIGLALVAHHRRSAQESSRRRAEELFTFALSGWDTDQRRPYPGGVFWVQQGVGMGRLDHSRNTVSNAPNAELGLLLELTGNPPLAAPIGAREMYAWVNNTLDASAGTGEAGTGLFYDHVKRSGEIEQTFWSYNQGTMIGANVLLHRLAGGPDSRYLELAAAIARTALAHYRGRYFEQPEAFNAIFFRNLLLLFAASGDDALRQSILETISGYAEEAWQTRRSGEGLFPENRPTLRDHGGMVQIFAMLARDPAGYEDL